MEKQDKIIALKNAYKNRLAYEPNEASEIVIEALEKQVPMKPVYDHRYHELGCVDCGNLVSVWEETPNYCPQCGQKLDWSDEDE